MTTAEQNLTEALAVIGIRHEKSETEGKRDWFASDGEYLGSYDAHEGWEKLRSLMEVAAKERAS